jgi:hypothetical protein
MNLKDLFKSRTTVAVPRNIYKKYDVKSYSPKELGFKFESVFRINIDRVSSLCGFFHPMGGAHTHVDYTDPHFGEICVSDEEYLFARNTSKPSELMWHEYFHSLVKYPPWTDLSLEQQHNSEWQEVAIKHGRPWIAASGGAVSDWWFSVPPNNGNPYWGEDWREAINYKKG